MGPGGGEKGAADASSSLLHIHDNKTGAIKHDPKVLLALGILLCSWTEERGRGGVREALLLFLPHHPSTFGESPMNKQ